ncbi:uroporphyrinogen-III synthase [Arthrobacter monumenti]
MAPQSALSGRTVALTRGPDRAGAMLTALEAAGAEPLLFPVIDFEVPTNTDELDAAVLELARGGFDWLIVTSITTVRALAQRAAFLGLEMETLVPGRTRVAAVGATTRRALEAEGIRVDLVPAGERSGQGLLEEWASSVPGAATTHGIATAHGAETARSTATVLLPQADIADPALREGLTKLGADVVAVTAYHTVNYPAAPERRLLRALSLSKSPDAPAKAEVLSADEFAQRQRRGAIDAVVLTSPSAARRVREECAQLNRSVKVVAIGRPTSAEATRCGFIVAAVAPEPTPEGIVTALQQAFAPDKHGAREESENLSSKEHS